MSFLVHHPESVKNKQTLQDDSACREWGLILGPPILVMGLLPSFRSVRIINIIALVGTNYSCLYFFIYGASKGIQPGIFTRQVCSFSQNVDGALNLKVPGVIVPARFQAAVDSLALSAEGRWASSSSSWVQLP